MNERHVSPFGYRPSYGAQYNPEVDRRLARLFGRKSQKGWTINVATDQYNPNDNTAVTIRNPQEYDYFADRNNHWNKQNIPVSSIDQFGAMYTKAAATQGLPVAFQDEGMIQKDISLSGILQSTANKFRKANGGGKEIISGLVMQVSEAIQQGSGNNIHVSPNGNSNFTFFVNRVHWLSIEVASNAAIIKHNDNTDVIPYTDDVSFCSSLSEYLFKAWESKDTETPQTSTPPPTVVAATPPQTATPPKDNEEEESSPLLAILSGIKDNAPNRKRH